MKKGVLSPGKFASRRQVVQQTMPLFITLILFPIYYSVLLQGSLLRNIYIFNVVTRGHNRYFLCQYRSFYFFHIFRKALSQQLIAQSLVFENENNYFRFDVQSAAITTFLDKRIFYQLINCFSPFILKVVNQVLSAQVNNIRQFSKTILK